MNSSWAQKRVEEGREVLTYCRPVIPGPAQPKTVTVCLCLTCSDSGACPGQGNEASKGHGSQLVPIWVLTVFRVFVFHAPFPDADLSGCWEALDSVAFVTRLGGCAGTPYIFRLRSHLQA